MLVLDVETSYGNKSNPFHKHGVLVCVGYHGTSHSGVIKCEGSWLDELNEITSHYGTLCGHNLKFDLHWLSRYGFDYRDFSLVDTQTYEYLLTDQQHQWASLEELGQLYLSEGKIDIIKEEYWSKGIDTTEIPYDLLADYCLQDCKLTYKIAQKQIEAIPAQKQMLFKLCMQDYMILSGMEENGLSFDRARSATLAKKNQKRAEELTRKLTEGISYRDFNFGSTDQLSVLLYGGTTIENRRIPIGHYKSGAKKGEVRYKREPVEHTFPRKYKPIKGTESAKEGYWATGEDVLRKLKAGDIVDNILEVRKLNKLVGTYYDGLCKKQDEYGWDHDKIYGKFNTAVTATGRLSSSDPNLQNLAGEAKIIFTSRYD